MNIPQLFESQQAFFRSHQTLTPQARKEALRSLAHAISQFEDQVIEALEQDLGRTANDSYVVEIGQVYEEIRTMLRHLDGWSRTRLAWTPLPQMPALSSVTPIPYGVSLIISPWNYPFALALTPLVDAIAAGNTAILKPSELSIHTSKIIETIIETAFDPAYVACVNGGVETSNELLELPFDFIFFTGSERVGKIVMEKASKHLAPVVLELGGKSPAIVDVDANLALAAKRIVWGKFINAGQTCVAPDYVLVAESVADEFLRLLKHEIEIQYPDPNQIGKIISQKHYDRLVSLIRSSNVAYGALASDETLQITPTILYPATFEDPIMQEEIFGPLLPVLTYRDFYGQMDELQKGPTPLSAYLFSRDPLKKDYFRKVMPFGGGCINDTIMQVANNHVPFGGLKQSGMGQYHGKYGFDTFSHDKAVISKADFELPVRYNTFASGLQATLYKWIYRVPR